jgi:hypothetical protein
MYPWSDYDVTDHVSLVWLRCNWPCKFQCTSIRSWLLFHMYLCSENLKETDFWFWFNSEVHISCVPARICIGLFSFQYCFLLHFWTPVFRCVCRHVIFELLSRVNLIVIILYYTHLWFIGIANTFSMRPLLTILLINKIWTCW